MATPGPIPSAATTVAEAAVARAAIPSLAARLAQYGLTEADAYPQALVVPQGKSLTLSAPAAGAKKQGYVTLTPKTIDDVKRWIGVPNTVGQRRSFPANTTSELAVVDRASFAALTKPQRQSLRTLAYQYVNGDSTALAHMSDSLSQLLVNATISGIYLLQDVDVLPNAELKLAASLKVFFANNLRIWKGGRIKILGNVKMDCASAIGNYTAPKIPSVINPSLDLGILTNFGA